MHRLENTPSPDTLRVIRVGGTRIVSLRGDVDVASLTSVRPAVHDVLAEDGVTHVSLDLSHVSFIDSSGVGLLVWAMKQARTLRLEFELVSPSAAIAPVLRVLGIDQIMTVR